MNFQDLLAKMKQLDESPVEPKDQLQGGAGASDECDNTAPTGAAGTPADALFGECGDDMPGDIVHPAPKQSDSVTMNVSMNGSGAGGIADLMKILRNIENGPEHGHGDADILVGMGEEQHDGGFQGATTEPSPETASINAVTNPPSDDLASNHGDHRTRQTGLPHAKMPRKMHESRDSIAVDESLVARLAQQYQEIKEAKKEKEPEGTYSSKRQETDGQRIARIAREKRQAEKKERMKNDFNAEMER